MKPYLLLFSAACLALGSTGETAVLLQYNFDTSSPDGKIFVDSSGNNRDLVTNRTLDIKNDYPFSSSHPELAALDKSLYNHHPYTTATYGLTSNIAAINLSTTNHFTLEGWVKPIGTDFGNGGTVISLSSSTSGTSTFTLGYNNSGNAYAIFNSMSQPGGANYIQAEAQLTLNAWNHLAYVYDRGNSRILIYLNGQEVATFVQGRSLTTELSTISVLTGGGLGQIQGYVDDIRLSDVALAPGELGYYTPFTTVPEPGTVALLFLAAGGLYGFRKRG